MSELNQKLKSQFKPELLITVYKDTEHGPSEYYLESHQVDDEGRVLEGKPLLQETIQNIVDVFFDENQNHSRITGYLPENILQYTPLPGGRYNLMWYRPEEIRVLHFAASLKLTTGKAWVPAMVYQVKGRSLCVYALKSNDRPVPGKTKLYRAPFHNVSDSGNVCLGSAKVKQPKTKTFETITRYWEDLFWLSEFTHLNGADNPTKSPLGSIWKKLVAKRPKTKWSDLDELIEMKGKDNNLAKLLR